MTKWGKISKTISNFYNFLLDLIFPKFCVGCGVEGEWFCASCQKKIIFIKSPTCPRCKKLTRNGQFCKTCRHNSYLTGVITAAYYKKSALKEAIHTFKYDEVFDLKIELGNILIDTLKKRWTKKNTILIPVPLFRSRQASRGFNQAELLARRINQNCNWPIYNCLKRIKYKKPQVVLSGEERAKNVKDAFIFRPVIPDRKSRRDASDQESTNIFKYKTILLIDDVYTTGSTLQECANALRQHTDVREIWGLVLAKV